METCLCG